MKTAKSYKIILLLTAFVLSIVAAFAFLHGTATVNAADEDTPSDYFTFTGIEASNASFTDGALVFKPVDGAVLGFKNKLVVNELSLWVSLPENVTMTVIMKTDSYYVHGQEIDGEYTTEIVGKGSLARKIDNEEIKFEVKNNYLKMGSLPEMSKYKVKNVNGITVVSVEISFDIADGANLADTDLFKLHAVDQNTSDASGAYKQYFTLTTDGKLANKAQPRVALDESFYTRTEFGGEYVAVKEIQKKYSLSMTAYSVLGNTSSSNLYVQSSSDKIILESGTDKPKSVMFVGFSPVINNLDDFELHLGEKVNGEFKTYETVSVEVKDTSADDKAPEYRSTENLKLVDGKMVVADESVATDAQKETAIAYNGFLNALKKQHTTTNAEGKETSVYLGSEFKVPSMADLVQDNYTAYNDLKYTVYYRNAETATSTSSFSFKLNVIGDYIFYAIFEDAEGNKMDVEKFLKEVDGEDQLQDNLFTFRFDIQDNADISVERAIAQGVGYVGVNYTASKFTVEASGCKLTYKLYYTSSTKAEANDSNVVWKEIPKASSVKSGYNKDGFDYAAVKAINYDGTLTFKPTKIGSYKIVCTATSEVSDRKDEDATVIRVYGEPTVYEAPSTWLRDNAWSVVFLSVGTLCLIGIIVLLFIKPKDDVDND